jgi:hypothetical protein
MHFVFIYGTGRIKPLEIVLRSRDKGRWENDRRYKFKIYCKHTHKYHNESSMEPLYSNKK